jgi:hypothetical protein
VTSYEIFSVVLACIAVIVSLVVWNGQRKMQREANNLQRATSELAKKQLEILLREEKGKNTARLSIDLFRDRETHRFRITNISDVEARDVEMELLLEKSGDSPVIPSEYDEKFPASKLPPGSSITLIAALHFGSPLAYNVLLKWTNPDGSRVEETTYVAL